MSVQADAADSARVSAVRAVQLGSLHEMTLCRAELCTELLLLIVPRLLLLAPPHALCRKRQTLTDRWQEVEVEVQQVEHRWAASFTLSIPNIIS